MWDGILPLSLTTALDRELKLGGVTKHTHVELGGTRF